MRSRPITAYTHRNFIRSNPIFSYILHGAYYSKDRDTRPKVWQRTWPIAGGGGRYEIKALFVIFEYTLHDSFVRIMQS